MTVAIIDYGSGNLRSAEKAFVWAADALSPKIDVVVTADPEVARAADRIVLPGVGAYGQCKAGLLGLDGMVEALEDSVLKAGRPFLGICVGMQLLADRGLEYGGVEGLGWIAGEVQPLAPADADLKVPHMGWNELTLEKSHPLLDGIVSGAHMYFVHGYEFVAKDADAVLATTDYGGAVTAMIARDNVAGAQFHPEKSQAMGLKLIENFLRWTP